MRGFGFQSLANQFKQVSVGQVLMFCDIVFVYLAYFQFIISSCSYIFGIYKVFVFMGVKRQCFLNYCQEYCI